MHTRTCCLLAAMSAMVAAARAQVPAQPAPQPRLRVLAHGTGEPQADQWALARCEAELRDIITRWHLESSPPPIDYQPDAVVVVRHGRGHGGEPAVAMWSWGADPSARLLRLAGDQTFPVVHGRWAMILLPRALEPERNNLRFETDVPGQKVGTAWRSVVVPCGLGGVEYLGYLGIRSSEIGCYEDAESWQTFCRRNLEAGAAVPECDFAASVLVAAPIRRLFGTGLLTAPFCTTVRLVAPVPGEWPNSIAVFAVPRRTGELIVETTAADDETRHHIAARFPVTDPSSAMLLRRFECDLEPRAGTLCERATTRAEWRALRDQFGGGVAALPDDWCNFTRDTVIAVATAAVPVRSGLGVEVATEEGVDVLTLTSGSASGGEVRGGAIVLKVPRRRAQLAVVLRRGGVDEGAAETTLRVFAGL